MANHRFSFTEDDNPENKPRACVVRYGAWGDTVQAASVCASLKKAGYHVTLNCSYPASEIVAKDPNIDCLITQLQDQIPMNWLGFYWKWLRERYKGKGFAKFVNLTESVEGTALATVGSVRFEWHPVARHNAMNMNYLEFQHSLAGVPYEPSFEFYPTEEEIKWQKVERERMRKAGIERLIIWAMGGSSRIHKVYPHTSAIWEHVLEHYPKWGIASVGDGSCAPLEAGFEGEPRVWKTCGKWTMRQVATMLSEALVVVGPETGVMSMAAFMPMPKIVFLSHSTEMNLTRDWVRTSSLWAPSTVCPGRGENLVPACHMMLPDFNGCRRHEEFGTSQCVAEIKPEWTWAVLQHAMITGEALRWTPPIESKPGE